MKKIGSAAFLCFRRLILFSGFVFLVLLVVSFTTWPYYAYHWLGTSLSKMNGQPRYIIFLGGSGMPSESNLMRAWFTAKAAANFPESKIVISIPGNTNDEKSTPRLVANELMVKGVSPERILFENEGTNTRWEALNLRLLHGHLLVDQPILIVSSPEHMRRAVLCFRKAGFINISALPAFENALEADLKFKADQLGGNKLLIPDVGSSISVRYQF